MGMRRYGMVGGSANREIVTTGINTSTHVDVCLPGDPIEHHNDLGRSYIPTPPLETLMLNSIDPAGQLISGLMRPEQVRLRFTRRDWLSAGCAGIVGLPTVLSNLTQPALGGVQSAPAGRRAKSVILILLTGGASQHDTFDLKPEAPEGIRGDFRPIGHGSCRNSDLRAPAAAGRASPPVRPRAFDVASGREPSSRNT